MKKILLTPVVQIILPECTDILTLSVGEQDSNGLEVDVSKLFQQG